MGWIWTLPVGISPSPALVKRCVWWHWGFCVLVDVDVDVVYVLAYSTRRRWFRFRCWPNRQSWRHHCIFAKITRFFSQSILRSCLPFDFVQRSSKYLFFFFLNFFFSFSVRVGRPHHFPRVFRASYPNNPITLWHLLFFIKHFSFIFFFLNFFKFFALIGRAKIKKKLAKWF